MLKSFTIMMFALLPLLAVGESSRFEASIALKVHDVPAFLSMLNERLGLRLPTKDLSDYAESIAADNEFSEGIDVHFRGTVRTVTYQIAKSNADEVRFSFESFSKELANAICQQMDEYSRINESARALKNCNSFSPESIRV